MNYTVTTRKKLPRNKYGDITTNSSIYISGSSSGGSSSGGSSSGGSSTQYSVFTPATDTTNGTTGLVPAPPVGSNIGTYIIDASTANWRSVPLLDSIAYGQPPVPGRHSCIMPMYDDLDIGAYDTGMSFSTAYITTLCSPANYNHFMIWHETYNGAKIQGDLRVNGNLRVSSDIYDRNGNIVLGGLNPSNYVTKTELVDQSYVTRTLLYSTISSYMDGYVKTSYLTDNYLTADYIRGNYATKSEIPSTSSFVTNTSLSSTLSSYAKKSDLSAYVTKSQLSAQSYITEHDLGEELRDVTLYWQNQYEELDDKITDNSKEWYNIRTERIRTINNNTTYWTFHTMIENYKGSKLEQNLVVSGNYSWVDATKYRLVLMTFRRHQGTSRSWRVPMFSRKWDWNTSDDRNKVAERVVYNTGENNTFNWYNTWWTIWGSDSIWFWNRHKQGFNYGSVPQLLSYNGTSTYSTYVINSTPTNKSSVGGIDYDSARWRSNKNKKKIIGCAIFKYTGKGTFGWERVSNISYLELFVSGNRTKGIKPIVCVKV